MDIASNSDAQPYIVEGLNNIGIMVGRTSHNTLRRWHELHGFPMFKLPNGSWAITKDLINNWGLARVKHVKAC